MIQTILTPIDGSMHAQAALELSIDLATKYDSQLVLLHVGIRYGYVSEELYDKASREFEKAESSNQETGVDAHQSRRLRILEYMGRMLLRNAYEQAKDKGVRCVETVIDFGEAAECILHHAKQKHVDLIAMGSRGLGGVEGLLTGSVSYKVSHTVPCSCMIIR